MTGIKGKLIKAMVKSHKVDVVCFQETKVQEMNRVIVQSLGMGRFLEWGALNSKGAAGGWLFSGITKSFRS